MTDESVTQCSNSRACVTLIPRRIRHLTAFWGIMLFITALVENASTVVVFGVGCVALVLLVYDSYNTGYEEAFEQTNVEDER